MNALRPIPMPKPIKLPKIASVHITPFKGGGFGVQHHMTSGPKPKPFVFSDPHKMLTHLKRTVASEWREPARDEAQPITKDLNIGQAE